MLAIQPPYSLPPALEAAPTMEYLVENTDRVSGSKYQINAIHSRRQNHYCVYLLTRGGLRVNWRAEAVQDPIAATRSSLSNHPEVNDPVEPANLNPWSKRSISSAGVATENSST